MEYDLGFERIREPGRWLQTGEKVETHTHNAHHNTDFTHGVWYVRRWQPITDENGVQKIGADGKPDWHELEALTIKGGGPRCTIPIPKNMKHEFTVLEGPAFYRCRFVWRDAQGNVSEVNHHYEHWNV